MMMIVWDAAKAAAVKFAGYVAFIQAAAFGTVSYNQLYAYMTKHRDGSILLSIFGFYALFHISYLKAEAEKQREIEGAKMQEITIKNSVICYNY